MSFLIKSAHIIDKHSPFHGQVKNILLEDGIIQSITDEVPEANETFDANGLCLSIGWFDMRVTIGDPGFEHKEDIISASKAAAYGGFTEIACLPNTQPAIQSKDVIAYIKSKSEKLLVEIHPIATVTNERAGKDISEMMDLHHSGAVAFTDADHPIWHSDLFLKTLQYLQAFDGLAISHAEEKYLSHGGQMNEGIQSTLLGLKGIPMIAEELMVARDLQILEYTGGKVHFAHLSSPASFELIRTARRKGLNVTCDVASYQIALDDSLMDSFDTYLKVNPPLRTKSDIDAILQAIGDNTVDVIVSDHIPQDEECKKLEFDLAEFGMAGLESSFGVLNKALSDKVGIESILDKIAYNPRAILKLRMPVIREGEFANLTLFDKDVEWTFQQKDIKSKSRNYAFVGHQLKGKAIAVFNKGQHLILN